MICPQCQHENADDARLCSICGATLQEIADDESTDPPETPYRTPAGHEPPPLPHGGFGDILDSTFSVYGRHLLPFIMIALLPQIPLLIGGIMSLMGVGPLFVVDFPTPSGEEAPPPLMINIWVIFGALLSSVITNTLANGAIIYGTGRHFLGSPVHVRRSYRYAWVRFPKLFGVFLLVLLMLIFPGMLSFFIIGIPLLIFAIVTLLFVNHAVMIDEFGPTDAVKRSWNVVQGNWWRTFGIYTGIMLAFFGATLVIPLIADLVLPAVLGGFGAVLSVLLSATIYILAIPPYFIAITALYFDIRVRKEQYTHNDLARELGELPRMEDTAGPRYETGG